MLKSDYSRIDGDIDKNWKETTDKIDKSKSKLVIMKNLVVRVEHPWANKTISY